MGHFINKTFRRNIFIFKRLFLFWENISFYEISVYKIKCAIYDMFYLLNVLSMICSIYPMCYLWYVLSIQCQQYFSSTLYQWSKVNPRKRLYLVQNKVSWLELLIGFLWVNSYLCLMNGRRCNNQKYFYNIERKSGEKSKIIFLSIL